MTYAVQEIEALPKRPRLCWAVFERGHLIAAFTKETKADAYCRQLRNAERRHNR